MSVPWRKGCCAALEQPNQFIILQGDFRDVWDPRLFQSCCVTHTLTHTHTHTHTQVPAEGWTTGLISDNGTQRGGKKNRQKSDISAGPGWYLLREPLSPSWPVKSVCSGATLQWSEQQQLIKSMSIGHCVYWPFGHRSKTWKGEENILSKFWNLPPLLIFVTFHVILDQTQSGWNGQQNLQLVHIWQLKTFRND